MKYGGKQLSGNFIHVGDHQQQTLRGRERRGQSARDQRAVHRARRAAFRLHLRDTHLLPEQVLASRGSPFVGDFGHRRRRSDGIYRRNVAECICDVRRGGIAINGHGFWHGYSPPALIVIILR
ncbi:hypothetical protein SDC9_171734 [bioreactor metagenome]|uniref:Uncharacterized protein n=1 Tax=bioreactor metagenome TaxID=1076179 RepID=A0A645GBQ5_9ZZZZ